MITSSHFFLNLFSLWISSSKVILFPLLDPSLNISRSLRRTILDPSRDECRRFEHLKDSTCFASQVVLFLQYIFQYLMCWKWVQIRERRKEREEKREKDKERERETHIPRILIFFSSSNWFCSRGKTGNKSYIGSHISYGFKGFWDKWPDKRFSTSFHASKIPQTFSYGMFFSWYIFSPTMTSKQEKRNCWQILKPPTELFHIFHLSTMNNCIAFNKKSSSTPLSCEDCPFFSSWQIGWEPLKILWKLSVLFFKALKISSPITLLWILLIPGWEKKRKVEEREGKYFRERQGKRQGL